MLTASRTLVFFVFGFGSLLLLVVGLPLFLLHFGKVLVGAGVEKVKNATALGQRSTSDSGTQSVS